MQHKDSKTALLAKTVGNVIKDFRTNEIGISINKFARELKKALQMLNLLHCGKFLRG